MSKTPRYPLMEYVDLEMPNGDTDCYISGVHSHLAKTRKNWLCVYCGAPINAGDFCLIEKGFIDHEPYAAHYCMDCVDDELDVWYHKKERDDAYAAWEKRYEWYRGKQT